MAEEERESSRGFRVQDRRRFSPETGEPRTSEELEQTSEKTTSATEETPRSSQRSTGRPASTSPPAEISFSSFILGLSTQALMYMGEIPSAPGQSVQTDLAAAQQMIDILALLKQKTAGNLDPGEDAMLGNALYDLRMRYVELARQHSEAVQSKSKE